MCLFSNDTQWHCAAIAGVWGDADYTFGPGGNERDLTMIGGMGVDLNETFTVHAQASPVYGACDASGALQWEVTRELSYLQGTVTGNCSTALYYNGRQLIGAFNHSCAVLTQVSIEADPDGNPSCVGCRCCDTAVGCPILPP